MQTFKEILFCLCAVSWTLRGVLEFWVASGPRANESYFKGLLAFGIAAGFGLMLMLDDGQRGGVMLLVLLAVAWFMREVDSK